MRFVPLVVVATIAWGCESEARTPAALLPAVAATAPSCLAGAGPNVTLSGLQQQAYVNTSLAAGTRIDASTAQFVTAAHISIRLGGGPDVCFHGGESVGQLAPVTSWSAALQYYSMVPDVPGVTIENIRTFDRGDGIAFGPNAANWTLRSAYIHYARDGCVENHFLQAGTVDDALLDGCFIGFASRPYRPTPDGSANVVTIENTLVRLQPMDGVFTGPAPGHGGFYEWSATSPRLALYNDVFRVDQRSNDGDEFLAPPPGKLAACDNNVMIWLGTGPFPEPLPSCFTLLTGAAGRAYWDSAAAQWQANHPAAGPDVDAPVVSLFAPAAGATLTGPVVLTATAVDDRALSGVQFQLDDTPIGVEVAADAPPTKYSVTWDSRSAANGPHMLSATARDAAGHTTTSLGVPVTLQNEVSSSGAGSGSCLAQGGGPTVTLSGAQTAALVNSGLAANTKIDATTAQFVTDANIAISLGGGPNVCFHGGESLGRLPPATSWSSALQHYSMVPDVPGVTVENIRTFDRGDGVAFGPNAADWTLRGAYIHYARDGCVENHFVHAGTVDDALLDGCFIGFASRPYRPTPDGSGNVMTIRNTLVRLQPMDGVFAGPAPGHGGFYEWSATSPKLALYNDVFRVDQRSNDGDEHLAPPPGKLADCANNVMIWLGAGAFPEPLPSCFTLVTGAAGEATWDSAVAVWKSAHAPATGDIASPVVSLWRPAAGSTLTGSVTLTATAVDDRDVASVGFQLNGQPIGAEVSRDGPATKFTLTWDSRSQANGTYTLTALARDAAGHTTTSAGVTITISN